jgi:hypothetical protein
MQLVRYVTPQKPDPFDGLLVAQQCAIRIITGLSNPLKRQFCIPDTTGYLSGTLSLAAGNFRRQ